jgi:hypothetical protein
MEAEEFYVGARMMKKTIVCMVLLSMVGCAGTGRMVKGETILDNPFPSGYSCTNYSFPYARAAYGIVTGQSEVTPGTSVHSLIGPPERECDPENAEMRQFAARADANKDRILTYQEVLDGIEELKGTPAQ